MREGWLFDKVSWSDGLAVDQYYWGGVSTKPTRSGGVVVTRADACILVDSKHLFLVVEGAAPAYLTLRGPTPEIEKELLESGDIRQAEAGVFTDWEVHIDGEGRHVVYVLGGYRADPDSYEADRVEG